MATSADGVERPTTSYRTALQNMKRVILAVESHLLVIFAGPVPVKPICLRTVPWRYKADKRGDSGEVGDLPRR